MHALPRGDDGLIGKTLDQLGLLVGEWVDLAPA